MVFMVSLAAKEHWPMRGCENTPSQVRVSVVPCCTLSFLLALFFMLLEIVEMLPGYLFFFLYH